MFKKYVLKALFNFLRVKNAIYFKNISSIKQKGPMFLFLLKNKEVHENKII